MYLAVLNGVAFVGLIVEKFTAAFLPLCFWAILALLAQLWEWAEYVLPSSLYFCCVIFSMLCEIWKGKVIHAKHEHTKDWDCGIVLD